MPDGQGGGDGSEGEEVEALRVGDEVGAVEDAGDGDGLDAGAEGDGGVLVDLVAAGEGLGDACRAAAGGACC